MSSTINLQALGLNYSPNSLSLPEGSLVQADNVIIRRDNTLESRRGIKDYSNSISNVNDRAKQLIEYKNRILTHFDNKLYFDNGTKTNGLANFEQFFGTYDETQAGLRIKSIEANKNLYFTTAEGIKKISAKTADDFSTANGFIQNAGAVKALDIAASLDITQGQKDGFLPQDSTVAYRVVWGYKDKNENLILGSPSNRYPIYNYIVDSMAMDINTLCLNLDNINQSGCLINDGDYANSFYTPSNSDTSTLKTTISSLAKKLDADILLGNTSGTGAPLKINSVSMDGGGLVSIFLESGDPTQYSSVNDYINIQNLNNLTAVKINTITAGISDTTINTVVHGLSAGNNIKITGTNTALDGDWEIKEVTTTTSFVIEKRTKFDVSSLGTGTAPKITTVQPHNLTNGNNVKISGLSTFGVPDAVYTATVVDENAFTITLLSGTSTGSSSTGVAELDINSLGLVNSSADLKNLTGKQTVTNLMYSNTPIVGVTASSILGDPTTISTGLVAHNFSVGDVVNISGTTSTGNSINGMQTVISVSTYSFDVNIDTFGAIITVSPSASVQKSTINFIYTPTAPNTIEEFNAIFISSQDVKINSYNYTILTETGDSAYATPLNDITPSIPGTSEQNRIINNTLSRIIDRLKIEKDGVIPTALKNNYIDPIFLTDSANVKISITIPKEIIDQYSINIEEYFYQVYRTRTFTADGTQTLGTSGGNPVEADDEMRLVQEGFPTSTEIANETITFIDQSPESLVANNTNLYTNPETGVGILNANEPPPFAKDINRFKNVVFYSNTRTKQRLTSFQLLGLSNINNGDKITITNDVDSSTYTFVSGVQQEVGITVETTTTSTSLQNKYFTINSANDNKSYCVYYILNNQNIQSAIVSGGNTLVITCYANHNLSSVPLSAQIKLTGIVTGTGDPDINGIYTFYPDPFNPAKFAVTIPTVTSVDVSNASFSIYFSDKTTKIVNILTTDSYADIADKTANTLNTLLYDFYVNKTSNVLTVTNVEQGAAQNPDSATVGSLFSIVVNKQGDGEDAANKQVLLSSLTSAAQAIEQTAQSLVRVINKNDTVINAFYTSSETTPPGQMILEAKTLSESPFYVIASTIPAGQSFNPDISPISPLQNTNIVEILGDGSLRTSDAHGLQNDDVIIISNVDSSSPLNQGFDGYKKVTRIDDYIFSVSYTTYNPVSGIQGVWSTPDNTIVSDNEVKANRVYYSKPNEPEAVPVLNYFDISAEDKEILRIYPLRNSLFVFKEDGTYRISGETSPFVVSLLDSSCVVRAPDSVSATNNIVYAWTTKGVTPISEAGASQEVSRPIDTEILRLSSSKFTNFRTITWGVGYDSDSSYTVYTNYNIDDEYATIAFRYCTLTNSWTNVIRSQTCGIIHIEEDKMYLGSATDNIINQERKSFDRTDYADKDFSLQISSGSIGVNTKQEQTISFTSVSEINVGDVITQEQELSVFLFNNLLKQLDTDPAIISAGTNTYYDDIKAVAGDNMRNKIVELSQRLDLDPAVSFSDYEERIANKNFPITQVLISSPTTISAGAKELTQFTIPTNVPFNLNIYNSKYFFVSSSYTNFVIWFNVDGTGTAPSLLGKFPVEVPLSSLSILNENDLATAISTLISTDMSTMFALSSYSLSNTFTIENQTIGPVQDATAETSGFSLNIVTTGSGPELLNGREITITGNSSIPSINGVHIVSNTTYGTSTTFTIPIDVTTVFFGGSFITNINSKQDIKICFNHVVSRLNLDPGLVYNSYKGVTETTLLEAVIVGVDKTKKQIAIKSPLEWIVGSSTIYNAINCEIQYAPITMGDTLNIKQLFDTTIMLKDRNITKFVASFSSDLKPEFTEVLFNGEGNGIFGYYAKGFGYGNFGGQSNNAPFRTLIPLQNQRCRFLNYKIGHNIAREVFVLYGISLTGNIGISFRGYR